MANIQIEHNQKFTTARFGCFIRMPLTQKNLALASVLATMQGMASEQFPGTSIQAKTLEEMYDMDLAIFPQVFGNQIIMFYITDFVEPREILDPDYSYQTVVDVFFNIVKKPLFNEQLLNITKQQLQAEMTQYFDVPANYANKRFFEIWYRNLPQFYKDSFGDPEVLKNCTLEDVQDFFNQLLDRPSICLGLSQDPDLLTDLIQAQFTWPGTSDEFAISSLVIPTHYQPIEKIENGDNTQTQLFLGYGYDYELPRKLRQYGGLLLSYYLAGDESSKLFMAIREKMGAAYAIDADNYLNNSLFLISTGIEKEAVSNAKKEILKAVQDVANGKVDIESFRKNKQAVKKIYVTSQDQSDSILLEMLANSLRGVDITFQDRIKEVESFTSQNLIKFAQSLFLNESYCLE